MGTGRLLFHTASHRSTPKEVMEDYRSKEGMVLSRELWTSRQCFTLPTRQASGKRWAAPHEDWEESIGGKTDLAHQKDEERDQSLRPNLKH